MLKSYLETNDISLEYYKKLRRKNDYLSRSLRRVMIINMWYKEDKITYEEGNGLWMKYILSWSINKLGIIPK